MSCSGRVRAAALPAMTAALTLLLSGCGRGPRKDGGGRQLDEPGEKTEASTGTTTEPSGEAPGEKAVKKPDAAPADGQHQPRPELRAAQRRDLQMLPRRLANVVDPTRPDIAEGPPFPRIANCYNAACGIDGPKERWDFLAKYDLMIGGFWRFDTGDPDKVRKFREMVLYIKQRNPKIIILDFSSSVPYVRTDRDGFPEDGYLLQPDGSRIAGWPGTEMINLTKPHVIEWLAEESRKSVELGYDGTFIDCMVPRFDRWACEIATGKPWQADADGDGKADDRNVLNRQWKEAKIRLSEEVRRRIGEKRVFMGNQAGDGTFHVTNGILFEDDLDYVLDRGSDWYGVVERYLHWTKVPTRPVVTTIVSSAGIEPPYEMWRLPKEEQEKYYEKGRKLFGRVRFGLTTALLGDGYFAYDLHTRARGQHWWYPEYDAPLGYPTGEGKAHPDGTWRRRFDGGTSIVNPTMYDVKVKTERRRLDVSADKVAREFVIPSMDGRILLKTREEERPGSLPDPEPLFTRDGPEVVVERGGRIMVRIANGWRALFREDGTLGVIDDGNAFVPLKIAAVIVSTEAWRDFGTEGVEHTAKRDGSIEFKGRRIDEGKAIEYRLIAKPAEKGIGLAYDFTARDDVHIHAFRIQVQFPASLFREGKAIAPDQEVTLPPAKRNSAWLADDFTVLDVSTKDAGTALRVTTSRNAVLRDERVYGGSAYQVSLEFPGGDFKAGHTWHAEVAITQPD